jgi:hypothetical protein
MICGWQLSFLIASSLVTRRFIRRKKNGTRQSYLCECCFSVFGRTTRAYLLAALLIGSLRAMHPHGSAVDLKERSGRPTSSGHPCRCPHHPERESTQFTGRGRGTHGLTHRSSMGMGPGPFEAWRASESDVTGRAQRFRQGARSRCRRGARSRRWGPARPTLTQMGLPSHPPLQHLHACTVSAVPQLCFFGQDTRRRAHPHQSLSL